MHSGRCFSTPWRAPERNVALAGIGAADDIPIARRLMVCRESEHRFERDVPVEAAVVAEDEFVEVGVGVFAAQAVIRANSPPFHQREDPVNPRQHDVTCHLADDARVMPVVDQSRIGSVAVGKQRGPRLHIGPHESFNRCGGVIRNHGKADAPRPGIEVFGSLALRLGLIRVAVDHLNGPGNKNFPGVAGVKETVAGTKGDFRLIDFDDPFEGGLGPDRPSTAAASVSAARRSDR